MKECVAFGADGTIADGTPENGDAVPDGVGAPFRQKLHGEPDRATCGGRAQMEDLTALGSVAVPMDVQGGVDKAFFRFREEPRQGASRWKAKKGPDAHAIRFGCLTLGVSGERAKRSEVRCTPGLGNADERQCGDEGRRRKRLPKGWLAAAGRGGGRGEGCGEQREALGQRPDADPRRETGPGEEPKERRPGNPDARNERRAEERRVSPGGRERRVQDPRDGTEPRNVDERSECRDAAGASGTAPNCSGR